MKILVICMNVGQTAAGIVNERLIYGLSRQYDTFVLTDSFNPSIDLDNVRLLDNKHYHRLPFFAWRILCFFKIATKVGGSYQLHWRIFRKIHESGYYRKLNRHYCENAFKAVQKQDVSFDLVLSVVSSPNLLSIPIGRMIKNNYGYKWVVYTVDAVPTPSVWNPNPLVLQEQNEVLSSDLSGIDEFYAANNQMLEYEKCILRLSPNCKTGVIYTPSLLSEMQNIPRTNTKDFIICYTGTLYGKRNVRPILQALDKLLEGENNIYIWFVGAGTEQTNHLCLTDIQRSHINFYPATNDLSKYYMASSCLLNIDADIDNDVFLSSKIINYLYVNRPILNITGKASVSRLLFAECDSIVHCNNKSDDIVAAIKQLQLSMNNSINDRERFIRMMNVDSFVSTIL